MKFPALSYLAFFAAAVLGVSCAEEDCTNLDDPLLNIEFRTHDSTTTIPRLLRERSDTIVVRSLYGIGKNPLDTLAPGSRFSLLLPLSQVEDTTSFRLVYNLREDTTRREVIIRVRYKRQPFFVSDVCGFNVRFTDLTVERISSDAAFDSIQVINRVVNEENAANIRMYFKSK